MTAGCDDTHIDRLAAVEAHGPYFAAGREHAIQAFLGFKRQSTNFIEQQRACIGVNELAYFGRECPWESAFLVTEQLVC